MRQIAAKISNRRVVRNACNEQANKVNCLHMPISGNGFALAVLTAQIE